MSFSPPIANPGVPEDLHSFSSSINRLLQGRLKSSMISNYKGDAFASVKQRNVDHGGPEASPKVEVATPRRPNLHGRTRQKEVGET